MKAMISKGNKDTCHPMATFGSPIHHSSGRAQELKLWNNHVSALTNAKGFLNISVPCSLATASTLTRESIFCFKNPEICSFGML